MPVSMINDPDAAVPLMWAREMIRDLDESLSGISSAGVILKGKKKEEVSKLIVDLSMEFQIMSGKASFVAVEEREEKDKTRDDAVILRVPAQLTKGWGGVDDTILCCTESSAAYEQNIDTGPEPQGRIRYSRESVSRRQPSMQPSLLKKRISSQDDESIIVDLLKLQLPEGGFKIDANAATTLQMSVQQLHKLANDLQTSHGADKYRLLSTAIVLAIFEIRYEGFKEIWEIAARKSSDWLDAEIARVAPEMRGFLLKDWAKQFISDRK